VLGYDWNKIKSEIIKYSQKINIDKIGITTADPFLEIQCLLREHKEKGYGSGFEEENLELRINPRLSLPTARSIIAIALAYPGYELERRKTSATEGEIRRKFCRASWGRDYHFVLQERLSKLADFIKQMIPEAETLTMVDTGPLSDRAVAVRAGLGWIGKNSNLITPEFGSFVYLGELLTNLPLPPDKPLENRCTDCSRCITACPMHAIIPGKAIINCQKCLAYQTLTKGFLSDELKEKIAVHPYIYGCDICQLVCPYNKGKVNDIHEEFKPVDELVNPKVEVFFQLSNKEFKEKYGQMSGSWRGKKNLERNAILILGAVKDPKTIPLLKKHLFFDPRPEIRAVAAWSLGKFNYDDTGEILKEGLQKEKDDRVILEIKKALNLNE